MPYPVQKRKRAVVNGEGARGRPTTPDADCQRSVSFSRRHLGAASSTEPGHRAAGPTRSSLRSPSPVKAAPINSNLGRDEQICAKVHELRDEVFALASTFRSDRHTFDRILNDPQRASETCRYIECLVIPERNGVQFWKNFLDGPFLPILVAALIGRALQEHVLGALLFGANDGQLALLKADEQRKDFEDCKQAWTELVFLLSVTAYHRIESRAEIFKTNVPDEKDVMTAQSRVAVSIFKLIAPLSHLDEKHLTRQILPQMLHIVATATQINHMSRQDARTLWQWTEVWKDSRFEPASTEAVNLVEVFETTSYEGPGDGQAKLRDGFEDKPDPIVRMVVFPGLIAWRLTEKDGVATGDRARRIMKNVALIEWDRQRKLTAAAGTSYHINAMKNKKIAQFDHDEVGAVNLWDLVFKE